jgi:iron complex outermembrane receptor protein
MITARRLPEFTKLAIAIAIAIACTGMPAALYAAEATLMPEVVVTSPAMESPLTVSTDPQAPRQPVPAHDGADYLKTIPGFSVIRKGGTDGDPLFRGMAGSRLNVLLDGEQILGGCGNRMDPPTAYVFPESYDSLVVLKGPQSVRHGPGGSAATVLFERARKPLAEAGVQGRASVMAGSFGRHDEVLDIKGGTPQFQFGVTGTNSHANDYEDGDGQPVHAQYQRWSGNGLLAWTPDADTWVALTAAASDGEAAYRDRSMDGAEFDRENTGLTLEKRNLSDLVRALELQVYRNYIDHVMDNYSLRPFSATAMMPNPAVSNPDRLTEGGRLAGELAFGSNLTLTLGVDAQDNEHTTRNTMNQATTPFQALPRTADASFAQYGLFAESMWAASETGRLLGGVRSDRWQATDERPLGAGGNSMGPVTSPTGGMSRSDTLFSGFIRHEHDASEQSTVYAGIGHSERFPDYWEIVARKESLASNSAFLSTRPEQNTQLDVGWIHDGSTFSFSLAAFYNELHDYILIESVSKPAGMMGTRTAEVSRNIDAQTVGAEAGAGYAISDNLKADLSLAWVRGENETDATPLAQQPPLEARLGLNWDNRVWSAGALLRAVAKQDRVDPGKGSIAGQDIAATPGFAVLSLNGSWRPARALQLAVGVDNLFDRRYAEHLSRSGSTMITGFPATTRVNEPGRNAWLKVSADF